MYPRPIGTPVDPVTITYDSRGTRASKAFENHYEARRFYSAKLKAGKNPSIKKGEAR